MRQRKRSTSTSRSHTPHAGLPVTIVRYFNSYGPRLDPRGYGSVVARFLGQALAGEPLTVHGDGTQTRCFTYVADTVRGTLLVARAPVALGRVFNIGSDVETTLNDLARTIIELTGSTSTIQHVSYESEFGDAVRGPGPQTPRHHAERAPSSGGSQRCRWQTACVARWSGGAPPMDDANG